MCYTPVAPVRFRPPLSDKEGLMIRTWAAWWRADPSFVENLAREENAERDTAQATADRAYVNHVAYNEGERCAKIDLAVKG